MFRIFRHYIPKTLLMLGIAEAVILLVSVYIGITLRVINSGNSSLAASTVFPKALVFTAVMVALMTATGLYQRDLREGPRAILLRLGLSFFAGLLVMLAVYAINPDLFVDGGTLGIALVASFLGIASCRFLCIPRTNTRLRRRVLVLGVGNRARSIANRSEE